MKFFDIKNSLEEFKLSYGLGEKAKSAAKVFGIAAANTVIAAGKTLPKVIEAQEKQLKKLKNK